MSEMLLSICASSSTTRTFSVSAGEDFIQKAKESGGRKRFVQTGVNEPRRHRRRCGIESRWISAAEYERHRRTHVLDREDSLRCRNALESQIQHHRARRLCFEHLDRVVEIFRSQGGVAVVLEEPG